MKSIWKFGSNEYIYAAIGIFLYGIISWIINLIQFPITGNDLFKPGIVIPLSFGIIFGPWVGFISGLFGSMLGDLLSGFSFWILQDLGYGLTGLVTGLCAAMMFDYRRKKDIIIAEIFVVAGITIGLLFVSLNEVWISGINLETTLNAFFLPGFLRNCLAGLILTPLMMFAYSEINKRTGRTFKLG